MRGAEVEPMQKVVIEWRIAYDEADIEFYGDSEDVARADYETAMQYPDLAEYAGAELQCREVVIRRQHGYWKTVSGGAA